ncbi:hypothetical protein ABIB60_001376 [Hymenobacter sp. UYP22]
MEETKKVDYFGEPNDPNDPAQAIDIDGTWMECCEGCGTLTPLVYLDDNDGVCDSCHRFGPKYK